MANIIKQKIQYIIYTLLAIILILFLTVLITGRTQKPDEFAQKMIAASSVKILNDEISGVSGQSIQIKTSIMPLHSNEEITWISGDEEIVTVKNGIAALGKSGSTTITAKASDCEASVNVTVLPSNETLKFSTDKLTVDRDKTLDISKRFEIKSNNKIEYSVAHPELAKIENDKLIPLSAGKTILTASDGESVASCVVEIRPVNHNANAALNLVNAYGNVYNTHPSALAFKDGFNGYKYWVAFTPYQNGHDKVENPHILVSNNLVDWAEPEGLKNPIEPKPENWSAGKIYNSDVELVYNSDTKLLECWWRFYDGLNRDVIIFRKTSEDGVNWGEKEQLLISPDMKYDFLSPSVIYEDGIYKMWSINQHAGYAFEYRESNDAKSWSNPREIEFKYERSEFYSWHVDVIHTPKGYEVTMSASSRNVTGHNDMPLFYSYSADNVNYTSARPMLNPTVKTQNWDNRGLYRSSLLYSDDKYYLFYSAMNAKKGPYGVGMISGSNPFNMK